MEKQYKNISELKEWDKNPRSINQPDYYKLRDQISTLGQYKPLLILPDGTILGGNMRIKAYKELGINNIWVSEIDFIEENGLFYAIVNGERQKKAFTSKLQGMTEYAFSDNDRAGYYDQDDLGNLIGEVPDLDLDAYHIDFDEPATINDMLGQNQEVTEDEPPAVDQTQTVSQLGEVYKLGRHRLMCGDATKIEDIEKLMDGQKADMVFTDPPYGVSYGDKNQFLNAISRGNRIQENLQNDTKKPAEMKEMWVQAFTNMSVVTKDGGSYYVCSPQGGELMMMMMSLLEAGWSLRQQIIWSKNNHVLGRSDYHYKHEPIMYGWKDGAGHQFYGGAGKTTIWNIDKPLKSDLHPTMKPIALMAEAVNNSSKEEDIILDLFGGSGSTLIACEQTNRTCYMMELDPKYCDVIRKRYAKFIGKEDQWQEITPIV